MDVCSPSATTPFLDRQYSHDVVRSHEPPVAERHHADVGGSHNVFLVHVHIVANVCSIQRSEDSVFTRVGSIAGTPKHTKRRGDNDLSFFRAVDPARPAQTDERALGMPPAPLCFDRGGMCLSLRTVSAGTPSWKPLLPFARVFAADGSKRRVANGIGLFANSEISRVWALVDVAPGG